MAKRSFRANPGDERTMVRLPDSANDLPELVSVDLDDKNPEAFEIVVNDDTPEDDQGKPSEWNDQSALDQEEEPAGYRTSKRINRLKAEIETRRRSEEAAQRERDAAAELARTQQAELTRLRQIVDNGNTALASSMKSERESRVADAKRRLAQAHAEGNSEEMASATADLTTATAELAQIAARTPASRPQGEQPPERQPAAQPAAPQMSPVVAGWIAHNRDWFNKDAAKTSVALSYSRAVIARGIQDSTPEFAREMDKLMKTSYPDHKPYNMSAEDTPDEEGGSRPRRSNAVEKGGRENGTNAPNPNPRRVELTQSELSLAKRLRLTPQQYAAEKLKYQQKGGA